MTFAAWWIYSGWRWRIRPRHILRSVGRVLTDWLALALSVVYEAGLWATKGFGVVVGAGAGLCFWIALIRFLHHHGGIQTWTR